MNHDILEFIAAREGFMPKVYRDTRNIPTIGYGFNLTRSDAPALIAGLGLNHQWVMEGGQTITRDQARVLLAHDVAACEEAVARHFPQVAAYPPVVKLILVDLVYNLGLSTFVGFKGFITAIKARRWALAGLQLIFRNLGEAETTGYWQQTKTRAQHHASTLGLLAMDELAAAAGPFPQEGVPS